MREPPVPPPHKDWQSPEVGDAVRLILDIFEGIRSPQKEKAVRMRRLGDLVRQQPEVTVSAFFAVFHAALGLPALLPTTIGQEAEIRKQIEQKVYGDIDEMP